MQTQAGSDRLAIVQHPPMLHKKAIVLGLCWIAFVSSAATAITDATPHITGLLLLFHVSYATAHELAEVMEGDFNNIAAVCATILVFVCFPGTVAVLVEWLLPRRKQETPDFADEDEPIS